MNRPDHTPTVLVVTSQTGVERDELLTPLKQLRDKGIHVTHAAPSTDPVQTFVHDTAPDTTVTPDTDLASVTVDDYDALVVPGGTVNADKLRTVEDAVELARAFAGAGKTIAAICHGPWLLVEADLVRGKTMTSYPSLQTDIRNAGGQWHDEQVARTKNGWSLITSRKPDDLDAFCGAIAGDLGVG
ncbi:type 1 glutamine amidotransferase domain-containing protein [Nocardia vermiculata]|uniref:Type 1 glutamine amidotransferase n=1 Tax=Nocardia vermiculata TaxID=257274 RepID=A0A846Y517_9NOCA|nr:type 1 glutamine amidotransferase domain-containing protein [Nocardia vermiculata]NKY53335.1 type 1 glutamine amidotransferase [Nocardia vermiculata]